MSRGKDFREPRRRGFDDDNFGSRDSGPGFQMPRQFGGPPRPTATGPVIDAVVKWFNPEKGFGFVELGDGAGDAFLHIAVLQGGGHETVLPGSKLRVQVGHGQKGPQVTAILEIDASSAAAPRPHRNSPTRAATGRERPNPATAAEIEGTVKWFNADKGFGFVG